MPPSRHFCEYVGLALVRPHILAAATGSVGQSFSVNWGAMPLSLGGCSNERIVQTKAEDSVPNSYQHPVTNRSKIDEKQSQIDEKLSKNHSWAVFGAQSRFRDAPGSVRENPGACQSMPGVDLGTPRARRGRPGVAQRCPQDGFKMLPSPSGATTARRWHDQHRRARQRCDF